MGNTSEMLANKYCHPPLLVGNIAAETGLRFLQSHDMRL